MHSVIKTRLLQTTATATLLKLDSVRTVSWKTKTKKDINTIWAKMNGYFNAYHKKAVSWENAY